MNPKVWLGLLLISRGPAWAEACEPPVFYSSLPRDREWYYGAGKDADPEQARVRAVKNLGKQVTGDLERWDEARVSEVAGPGHDRWEVAKKIGSLLPESTLLSGWEQDDSARCKGVSYAMVRIEKERVQRFIKENAKFKSDLLEGLSKRVEKVEADVAGLKEGYGELTRRLVALEARLGDSAARAQGTPLAEAPKRLSKDLAGIRVDISAKRPIEDVARKLAAAKKGFKSYERDMDRYLKARLFEMSAAPASEKAAVWKALAREAPDASANALRWSRLWDAVAAKEGGREAPPLAEMPSWASDGAGPYSIGGRRVFRGVGLSADIHHAAFSAGIADFRACGDAKSQIDQFVAVLSGEGGAGAPGSGEGSISQKSFQQGMTGSRIAARWRDAAGSRRFSLCELEMVDVIAGLKPAEQARASRVFDDAAAVGAVLGEAEVRPSGPVAAVSLSADGSKALSSDDAGLSLWDARTGKRLWTRPESASWIDFAPGGGRVVSGSLFGHFREWDLEGRAAAAPLVPMMHTTLTKDYISDKGEEDYSLFAKGFLKNVVKAPGLSVEATVVEKESLNGTAPGSRPLNVTSEVELVQKLKGEGPEGTWLRKTYGEILQPGAEAIIVTEELRAPNGATLQMETTGYTLGGGLKAGDWSREIPGLSAAALSPDGRAVLSGSDERKENLILWNYVSGKPLGAWTLPAPVTAVAFSADGKTALVGLAAEKDNLRLLTFQATSGGTVAYAGRAVLRSLERP